MTYPFGNIKVGSYPNDGTGDPLRTAFETINNNFANIASGQATVNAPVMSVAGRVGNVVLGINDIVGAASYAYVANSVAGANSYTDIQISLVNSNIASLESTITATVTASVEANINLAGTNANIAAANVAIAALQANDVSQFGSISSLNASIADVQNNVNANSANIVLVQSGATATNVAVASLSANLGAFQSYANATFSTGGGGSYGNANVAAYLTANPQSGTYSNSNVASYLPTSTVIAAIDANIVAVNLSIAAIDSNVSQLQSNGVTQFVWLNNLSASVSTVQNNIVTIQNSASADQANIALLQSGATATNAAIVTANTAVVNYVNSQDSVLQSGITGANAAIVTANTAMKSYVDAVTTAWTANAGVQAVQISNITANVTAINLTLASHGNSISSLQSNSVTQFVWLNNLTATTSAINNNLVSIENTLGTISANVTTGPLTVSGNITGGNVLASAFLWANGQPLTSTLNQAGNIQFSGANISSTTGKVNFSSFVGIHNINPGAMLGVGDGTTPAGGSVNNTGNIDIGFSNGRVGAPFNGDVTWDWDWDDGTGVGTNPGVQHANFGLYKTDNGGDYFSQPLLTFNYVNQNTSIPGNLYLGTNNLTVHNILGNVVFGPAQNLTASSDSIITINPGYTTPAQSNNAVHLQALDGSPSYFGADAYGDSTRTTTGFLGRRARGTSASPANVAINDVLLQVGGLGYGSTSFKTGSTPSGIQIVAAENYTDTAQGTSINFSTTRLGTNVALLSMHIDSTGNVVIPATTASGNVVSGALLVKGGVGIVGNVNVGSNITAVTVRTLPTTVSSLPSASSVGAGTRAFVTDANTTIFNSPVGGGSSNAIPVFSTGTSWYVG